MEQIHLDMALEIVSTNLCDLRAKSLGAVSKNVFCKNPPDGAVGRGSM